MGEKVDDGPETLLVSHADGSMNPEVTDFKLNKAVPDKKPTHCPIK